MTTNEKVLLLLAAFSAVAFLFFLVLRKRGKPSKPESKDPQASSKVTALFNAQIARLRKEALAYKLYELAIQHKLDYKSREKIFTEYGRFLTAPILTYWEDVQREGLDTDAVATIESNWLLSRNLTPAGAFDRRNQIVAEIIKEITPKATVIIREIEERSKL